MKTKFLKRVLWLMIPLLTIFTTDVSGQVWKKVTSAPDSWAGEYLLVYESSSTAGKAWTGVDAASCGADVTISSGVISTKPDGAVSITVAAVTGGYSIKINGGTNNGKYIGRSANSNGMDIGNSAVKNTFSYVTDNVKIVGAGGAVLRYNSGSGQERFRYFKSSTYTAQKVIQLYKKSYTVTYNANGGSGTMTDASSPYASGASVTVKSNSFTAPTGKVFNGWNTKANGSGTSYAAGATFSISAHTTLYAQWASAGTSVSLTKAAATNGSFTLSPASSVTTTGAAGVVTVTATPDAGYYLSNLTATNPTTGTAIVTGSGNTRTVTYSSGANGSSTITATFSAISRTISYSGDTHISSYTTKPTSATIEDDEVLVEYTVASGYVITAISATMGGAAIAAGDMDWNQTQLEIMPTGGITGNIAITFTIAETGGYCISAFNSSNNGITSGFSNGGSGSEYTLSYTIPGKDGSSNWPQYWIGENNAFQSSYSVTANFADMPLTSNNSATLGLAQGATGTLHIWNNNIQANTNLYVKFEPSGYGLRWGGAGEWDQAANTKAFTVDPGDANVYWTDIVTLDGTNNTTWNYYVGLQTASGYVYSGVDNEASDSRGISRTRSVTAMKVSNGTSGSWKATYLDSEPTNSRGKFRIWNNNITDYNFVCHWVPFYRVTYNGSGASGSTSPSADVCCEGNAAARTVKAAANGFTVPTGKSFGGWASSPENAAAKIVAYAANADVTLTGSITLYAIWNDIDYTVTVNQSPSVGATTTGQTTTAHYNGTINLTTTVPSGYRFVNWTTSDGFSITNSTSATTASFTMPNKSVTVTANFQQTHTVDWYVGGSAPANKIGDDGQTTVVDHGGKISDFPATTPDGSPCDKTFVGWTNTSSYVHGTSPLFNDVAGSPTINADASFYAVFAAGGATEDEITVDETGATAESGTYSSWSDVSISSNAVYAGNTAGGSSGNASVQMRSNNSNSGIVTTASGGKVTKVVVDWNSSSANGRTLDIYGKNTAYTAATDLYDNSKQGTKLGSIVNGTSTELAISGDYSYIGLRSNSGAMYLNSITISWSSATGHTINCTSCANSVTVNYSDPGSGNTMAVTKGSTPIASGTSVKTCSAQSLTVTLTPATHYTVTNFEATGVAGVTTTNVGNVYTVSIPADKTGTLTLNPTFTPETPLTITLNTNNKGTFDPIGDVYSGESFTFPVVTPSDAECASFLGWIEGTTFDGAGETTDPSDVTSLPEYHAASTSSGTLTTNKTYTAVFGEKDTKETTAYVKVTSAPADWSGDYLIVRESIERAFNGSLETLDAANNYIDITIVDGKIAKGSLAANQFTIAKVGATNNYTIKSASGKYIGRTATSNGLDASTSIEYTNTLAYSSDHVVITSSGGPTLQMNGGTRFRYYASSQQELQLYKLGTAQMITYTYTTNPACTPRYRVTVNSAVGGSPSADKTYEHADEAITLTAHPAAGYSFTGWTITHTEGGAAASVTYTTGSASTETAVFEMPAYDVTVTASYAKIPVASLQVKDGETVIANSGTVNISTGANKTLTVVVTPADAFDHSWSASVTGGGTYASITNVQAGTFQVNGLAQGDATIVVTAPNDDGADKTATFTVHVTDVLPEEIILKRDGSNTPIETLIMYYDETNSKGQYVKVNVGYSPANPTNKAFTFSSALTGKVGSHSHAPASGYEVLVANGVTASPVNCTFTSSADGSVTKVLAVTVLPILTDRFVDYVHGNATQTVSARLSDDRYSIIPDINTPSLSDASDANPTSEDCETSHYHLVGWLPQTTAEALWAAGTPITDATEGLVRAGESVEATGQTWCAIWAEEE